MVRITGWIAACLLSGAALGWVGSQVAGAWSPLLFFSLLLGLILGAILVVLMRVCQVHNVVIVYGMAILTVGILVISQHWLAYREAVLVINEDIRILQKAANQLPDQFQGQIPTPPKSFVAFMSAEASRPRQISTWFGEITIQGAKAWTFWGLDALLVLLPTLFLLWKGRARPWCPTCRSWYRTTRIGRLDRATTKSILAVLPGEKREELPGEKRKESSDEDSGKGTFMIRDCDGRCGKTEFRILFASPSTIETWHLDPAERRAMEAILERGRST